MKILILDSGNTYNYGSMMMAENVIYYMNKNSSGKNVFYVHSDSQIHIDRLIDATGIQEIQLVSGNKFFWCRKFKIAFALNKLRINPLSALVKNVDKIIFLGGDDFTEVYGVTQLMFVTKLVDVLNTYTKKVFLLGQTIGPFEDSHRERIVQVLRKVRFLSVRDPQSMTYCKENGVAAKEIADFALLPLAKEQDIPAAPQNVVLLCPSEIMNRYAKCISRDDFIKLNVMLCTYICSELHCSIELLPHVYDDRSNGDIGIARDIYNSLGKEISNYVHFEEAPVLPYQVRELIRDVKFIIAERMHPAISGLECGVPSLVFSYGSKYEGIFCKLYQIPDVVLDVRNFDNVDSIFDECVRCIGYIIRNNEHLRIKISAKTRECQPVILEAISEI